MCWKILRDNVAKWSSSCPYFCLKMLDNLVVYISYQERGGVEGGNGDGIKDLRLLQGFELLLSVA